MTAEEYIRENYGERWLTPSAEWTSEDVIDAMEEYASQSLPGEEEIMKACPQEYQPRIAAWMQGARYVLSRFSNSSEQPVGNSEQLKGFDEEQTKLNQLAAETNPYDLGSIKKANKKFNRITKK